MDNLKRQAEAQMRRRAPEEEGETEVKRPRDGLDRQTYALEAINRLSQGCACFLVTTGFRREKSACNEAMELLQPRLGDAAVSLSPVKVSCCGVVLLMCKGLDPMAAAPIVQRLFDDVEGGACPRPRWCQRIIPAATSCLDEPEALSAAVARVCAAFAAAEAATAKAQSSVNDAAREQPPLLFAVTHRTRSAEPAATDEEGHGAPPTKKRKTAAGGAAAPARPAPDDVPCSSPAPEDAASAAPAAAAAAAAPPPADVGASLSAEGAGGVAGERDPPLAAGDCTASAATRRAAAIQLTAAALNAACTAQGLPSPKADLKNPQVVLAVEEVPVGRARVCLLAVLPASLCVPRKLAVKPLAAAAKT